MDGNMICSNRNIYIFDEETGLWSSDQTVLMKYVYKYRKELTFTRMTNFGPSTYDYGGTYSNINNMFKFVPTFVKTDDNFIDENIDTSKGKLLFANGIYHFDNDTFTEGFDINIVFDGRISRNFNRNIDPELVKYVNKVIFEDPFESLEVSRYLKIGIARGLYGDYLSKMYYALIGSSDSGKGVVGTAIEESCKGYVGNFNSPNLYYTKNTADDEFKNKWMLPVANKRIAISSEMDVTKETCINSVLLKRITSGGDVIKARSLNKDAISIKFRALPILFGNDMPAFKPCDEATLRRSGIIEMDFQFKTEEEYKSTNAIHKKMIPDIKRKFQTNDDYKDALIIILINAYQDYLLNGHAIPQKVHNAKKEWISDENSLEGYLEDNFIITKNKDDYVESKEIIDYLLDLDLNMSAQKIGRELTVLIGLKPEHKKINGKNSSIRRGIKDVRDACFSDDSDFETENTM